MLYDGVEGVLVDEETGELVIQTPWGEMRDAPPVAHQDIEGIRKEVDVSFRLMDENRVSFAVGNYDLNFKLIIDPGYSTYLGGSDIDLGRGVAVDSSWNAYVTGWTTSSDFPTQKPYLGDTDVFGGEDVFVTKLSGSGDSLVYSTYLGGSSNDNGFAIAIDSDRQVYVTGWTTSSDFPTQKPYLGDADGFGGSDMFVAKLSGSGDHLVYSTYLGGSSDDYGRGITVDRDQNAYVTGDTYSSDFPTTQDGYQTSPGGKNDAFATKLSSSGSSLVYSTYIGRDDAEIGEDIAVDDLGQAYITGLTASYDFPTQNPYQGNQGGTDAFVTKLNINGDSLIYSTYIGGDVLDEGLGVAVGSFGNIYVTGLTNSSYDFPTQNPYQDNYGGGTWDAFVTYFS